MLRSELAACVIGVAVAMCAALRAGTMEHFGEAPSERVLACVRSVIGKEVYADGSANRLLASVSCPQQSAAELLDAIKARDITIIEKADWVYLLPTRRLKNPTFTSYAAWSELQVVKTTINWTGIPHTRVLTDSEQAQVASVIFANTRTTPLITPFVAEADGKTATVEYPLRLVAVNLTPQVESVIGILGQPGAAARLVYGEMHDGRYEALWDSPVFSGLLLQMGFEDLNGDGVKEILLQANYGIEMNGMLFSALDRRGRELTRQADCVIDHSYAPENGLCPVAAEHVQVQSARNGTRDLLVSGRHEDLGEPKYRWTHRYTLRDGHYVYVAIESDRGSERREPR
jgi:hypothetical protein